MPLLLHVPASAATVPPPVTPAPSPVIAAGKQQLCRMHMIPPTSITTISMRSRESLPAVAATAVARVAAAAVVVMAAAATAASGGTTPIAAAPAAPATTHRQLARVPGAMAAATGAARPPHTKGGMLLSRAPFSTHPPWILAPAAAVRMMRAPTSPGIACCMARIAPTSPLTTATALWTSAGCWAPAAQQRQALVCHQQQLQGPWLLEQQVVVWVLEVAASAARAVHPHTPPPPSPSAVLPSKRPTPPLVMQSAARRMVGCLWPAALLPPARKPARRVQKWCCTKCSPAIPTRSPAPVAARVVLWAAPFTASTHWRSPRSAAAATAAASPQPHPAAPAATYGA